MSPVRIQRRRTKGWRMPEGAVYVGRPSRWGNPYPVGSAFRLPGIYNPDGSGEEAVIGVGNAYFSVVMFRAYAERRAVSDPEWLAPLRGRVLACWCGVADEACHADVLLELANR